MFRRDLCALGSPARGCSQAWRPSLRAHSFPSAPFSLPAALVTGPVFIFLRFHCTWAPVSATRKLSLTFLTVILQLYAVLGNRSSSYIFTLVDDYLVTVLFHYLKAISVRSETAIFAGHFISCAYCSAWYTRTINKYLLNEWFLPFGNNP